MPINNLLKAFGIVLGVVILSLFVTIAWTTTEPQAETTFEDPQVVELKAQIKSLEEQLQNPEAREEGLRQARQQCYEIETPEPRGACLNYYSNLLH